MGLLLLASDLAALVLAGAASFGLRRWWDGGVDPGLYLSLWPLLGIFALFYALAGLYPGVGVAPAEELRRIAQATTLVYLLLGVATFMFKEGETYSRAVFLTAWAFSVALVPLGRAWVRHLFARKEWWGYPVAILGGGETGRMVLRALQRQPGLGLKPVVVLDDDPEKHGLLEGVPVVGGIELAPVLVRELGVQYAIVAMPGVPRARLLEILEEHGSAFTHLVLIPDLFGFPSLWVSAKDLGGTLGLEVRQRLLLPGPRLAKRALDLGLAVVVGLLLSPLLVLIALLIKLDSPGPVFYGQVRIGQGGRRFKVWKFRSMVQDADRVLREYLERHPELREEWERYQKLRNDPRVTRVGRFLRKTSLDELPQLWNVLRGEMSLVGPRPFPHYHLEKFSPAFRRLRQSVLPGLTGLWQVSARSEGDLEVQEALDTYYIRNWSLWLDLYILARTAWVVLTRKGAY
jgi:Undecaprenyl-phosphate galactose phosphotransferase WbaP